MMQMLREKSMCKKLLVFLLAFCLSLIVWQTVSQFAPGKTASETVSTLEDYKIRKVDRQRTKSTQNSGKNNSRFGIAGLDDDRKVIDLYLAFQKAVAEDDKKTIASLMIYPLRISFPKDKPTAEYTLIKNSKAFLKVCDKIFDSRFKKFILEIDAENDKDIWARYDGIAVGRGVIWIGFYCDENDCEKNAPYIKFRTLHANSNLID